MNAPQEALSAALIAHAEGAYDVKPELRDAGYRGWVAVRIMAGVTKGLSIGSALIEVAASLPIQHGRTVLGPQATAVLDDLLQGEVDTLDFFDALTNAIKADTATSIEGGTGGPR